MRLLALVMYFWTGWYIANLFILERVSWESMFPAMLTFVAAVLARRRYDLDVNDQVAGSGR